MATLHCNCQIWVLEKQDDDYVGSGDYEGQDYEDTPILNKFKQILEDEIPAGVKLDLKLSWTEFKNKAEESYVVVATGEPTPHGSIILEAGVLPMGDDDYNIGPCCVRG